jgi:ELWxxDGT repeat protein
MDATGTPEGTYRIADVRPGVESSSPRYLVAHEPSGSLFFAADAEPFGAELWRFRAQDVGPSEGNLSPRNGTVSVDLVEDVRIGEIGSDPRYLTIRDPNSAEPSLFFSASDGLRGRELWIAENGRPLTSGDGSGAATHIVKDIWPGSAGSDVSWIVMLDPHGQTDTTTCLFAASDGVLGQELWKSDGTEIGTAMVRDIHPGASGSHPAHLTYFDGMIYFQADDGTNGVELWRSDGSPGGTSMLFDLCSGYCSGSPGFFSVSFIAPLAATQPERLFFTANPGKGGRELWIVTSDAVLGEGVPPVTVARAFHETTKDIDIDELRHMKDYPVRMAQYRGSLYWSGNEGVDPDTQRPQGGVYGGDRRNGTAAAIVIEDVDLGQGNSIRIQLSAGKGVLTLARTDGLTFVEGSGQEDPIMDFMGELDDVNLAFESLVYTTLADENGADAITVKVNDTGQTGTYGYMQVVTNTIDIWIQETNDPPVILADATALATRNLQNTLPVLLVTDIDVGEAPLEITLRARYGRITLNSLRGISFGGRRGTGTGVMDRLMVFYGDLRAVNDALRGMQYECRSATDGCVSKADKIILQVRDLDSGGDNDLTSKHTMVVNIREPTVDEVQGFGGGSSGPAL